MKAINYTLTEFQKIENVQHEPERLIDLHRFGEEIFKVNAVLTDTNGSFLKPRAKIPVRHSPCKKFRYT